MYRQKPLTWEVFSKLMNGISDNLKYADSHDRKQLATYQVAIAFGCYNGPTSSELRQLKWKDMFRNTYTFKHEDRSWVVMDRKLRKMALKNYRILDVRNPGQYVLLNDLSRYRPIYPIEFNQVLANIFEQFGVNTPEPNFQTLRMTFACKVYRDFANNQEALQILSKELGYNMATMKDYVNAC